MRILKYNLEITKTQEIEMPAGAKILSVENQNENIVLYAMVNVERHTSNRTIEIIATGSDFDICSTRVFIGTVKILNGQLMYHVFEL